MDSHQGGDEDRAVSATVIALVIDGLREVKESISGLARDMNAQMSKLPDIYVPRREIEHRLDEHTIDIGELRSQVAAGLTKHEGDIDRIEKAIETVEQQRRTERKWAFGAAMSLAGLMLTALALVASLFAQLH